MASLEKYRECDPEVMQQMKEETEMAREAANRWTGEAANRWTSEACPAYLSLQ